MTNDKPIFGYSPGKDLEMLRSDPALTLSGFSLSEVLVLNTSIRSMAIHIAMVVTVIFGASVVAPAQRYLGTIQGEITDPTGAKVAAAKVTAEETTTHFKTDVVSNDSGSYSFASLNPGTYTISVSATGFRAETITSVILTAGQLQNVDFKLNVGTATESVEVLADQTLLDTGSANVATTLSTQEVTDLPNNGRNPFVMASLGAGVLYTGYFQAKASQFTNPFSGVAIQLAADGSGGHNRLTLDGIPDDPAERFSGATYTGFVPSPEAVQEVKIQTSMFDAQVGHGNGTVTNTVVKSGTNKIHGAIYYAFQNTYINANTSEKSHVNSPRNNDQLSQTGFVVDGPVFIPKVYDGRDKTFFMVAYERYASHTAINYQSRVPTAAELKGDFSGLCNTFNANGFCTSGQQLYVPTSPLDANNNRTQYFPNNNIAAAITATGAAFASYYPAANVPGAAPTSTLNYISNQTSYPSKYPSFIIRMDHSLDANDKFNAIYFQAGLTQNYPLQGFPKGIGPNGYGYNVYRNTRGGSLDEVHQFSSSMVLDSRLGVTFHPFGLVYPGSQNFNLASLGIASPGLPYSSFPGVTNGDSYASLAPGAGGQISEDTTGSLEEILTRTIRTHTVRFGFEGNLIRYNVQNPESGFGNGSGTAGFNFDRRFTQQNSINVGIGADPNSGDSFADLLLGDFSSTNYTISPAYALQQIYTAGFVQDDWRVTPKLTLNLGMRWDYESPFTERYNKQVSNFCTTCVNPLQTSVPGLPLFGGLQYTSSSNRYPYPREFGEFQPRVGAAYQIDPKTVIRAGYGLIYFNTLETPIGTGFSQSTSYNNYVTSAPVNAISNPYPSGVVLPTGSSLGLSTAVGQNISFIDPNHVQPRDTQFTLNVQRQLPQDLTVQVSYVGARPTHLEVNHNINVLPAQYYNQGAAEVAVLNAAVANPMAGKIPLSTTLNAATIQQQLLYLPYPEFGSVTEDYSPIGTAPYNALQIQISKPMKHRYTLQGNMTWDKIMLHNTFLDNYALANGKLESVQDSNPTLFGNLWGTYQLPHFDNSPAYERLLVGGWQLNVVSRFSNGALVNAPSNVNIIGNYKNPNWTLTRQFNTCYQSVSIVNNQAVYTTVNTQLDSTGTYNTVTACDSISSTPAFQQRLSYTSQTNSPVLNIRQQLHPVVDMSLFKQFIVREGVSFEIRGEFYNVMNTPEWGAPSTTLGAQNAGSSASGYSVTNPHGIFTQANDPRIGELTARINF